MSDFKVSILPHTEPSCYYKNILAPAEFFLKLNVICQNRSLNNSLTFDFNDGNQWKCPINSSFGVKGI